MSKALFVAILVVLFGAVCALMTGCTTLQSTAYKTDLLQRLLDKVAVGGGETK